ncbi:MAG: histidine kinase dimerization/phosphoacceptor domain -containing protein [Bacteroidota bacterium]
MAYQQLKEAVDAHQKDESLILADSLLALLTNDGDNACPYFDSITYERGEALEFSNRWAEALELYYALMRSAEVNEHWALLAETQLSAARVHESIGRGPDCLRYLNLARDNIKSHNLGPANSRFHVRFASYHRIHDSRDTAYQYALKAIELGREYNRYRSELDGNLVAGITSPDPEKAIGHLQDAARMYLKRGSFLGASWQKSSIASKYVLLDRFSEAHLELDSAFYYLSQTQVDSISYYDYIYRLYDRRAYIFTKENKFDSAFHYQGIARSAEQLTGDRANQTAISEREIAFAIEREQQKVAFEQQRSRLLGGVLIAGGLALIFLLFLLFNNRRKRREIALQNEIIGTQNSELNTAVERQRTLIYEIHHRVKNNLQLVMSLLTLQGRQAESTNVQQQLDQMANRVRSIALIHEQLYQTEEFADLHLPTYMERLAKHFASLPDDGRRFDLQLDIIDTRLNLETVMPIGLICAELIGNSLKYARRDQEKLKLNVSIQPTENSASISAYLLKYQDNGPGYPEGTLSSKIGSMGRLLIQSMTRQLRASNESFNDHGAVFKLVFQEKVVSNS